VKQSGELVVFYYASVLIFSLLFGIICPLSVELCCVD
jgi:hypothetical protein